MGWGRMDDGFDDHPKVVAILDEEDQTLAGVAIGVWTLCWSWAHRNTRKPGKTPGLVPAGLPRRFLGSIGRKSVDLLVKQGLWHEHESGGWVFHDFGDYLPTDGTREARSEAGKRGAAARWASREAAENAGNAPTSDGNLPSVCHDADGKAVANDGSRAPARRDPTPTPTPTPNNTEHPSDVLFGETAKPTPRKRRATKIATTIPDDFTVTPEMVAWAREKTPLVDGKFQTDQFVDHWRAATRNEVKKDWTAAWRTWMRNAQQRAAERGVAEQGRRTGYSSGYPDRNGVATRNLNPPAMSAEATKARGWMDLPTEEGALR